MSNIKPGTVVRLKSGGPAMTVESIENNKALCVWFDDKNQPVRQVFPLHALEIDEMPDSLEAV